MAEAAPPAPYNPYEHREIDKPLNNVDAFVSLLKCVIGTGILAMPLAFYYSGLLNGTVMTILLAIILSHGMHMLIGSKTETCRRYQIPQVTFPDAMRYCFKEGPNWMEIFNRPAGFLVNLILGLSHFGVCIVYVVFVSNSLKHIIDYNRKTEISLRIYTAVLIIPLFPLMMLRKLKYLVIPNLIANILLYVGFFSIFYYVLHGLPPIGERALVQDFQKWPLFFGIVLFALTSVGVMIAIEANMATPQDYLGLFGIFNAAMAVVVVSNIAVGFFGYWRYGENCMGSITLNIPKEELLPELITGAMAIAIFLTYPLSAYVTVDIIVNHFILEGRECKHPHLIEYFVRGIFVLLSVFIAALFPNLGPLVALVGAFSISLLNMVFPAIMNICLHYKTGYGFIKLILIKDFFMIIFGIVGGVIGSTLAIKKMIKDY